MDAIIATTQPVHIFVCISHVHNAVSHMGWVGSLGLVLQRRGQRLAEVKQHTYSPPLDANHTVWTEWLMGVLVFHILCPNLLEVQPGISSSYTSPFFHPKGSFQVVPSVSYLKVFICSYHRFQNRNNSPSQRRSLQRVTMKRLSHMTHPSTVHPGARAGAWRGCSASCWP